jgi:hypothetical protein
MCSLKNNDIYEENKREFLEETNQKENLEKKIIEFLIKKYPDYKDVEVIDENLLICEMSRELESANIINFSLEYRESDCDSWLQCEYYSKKVQKTIIFDYDSDVDLGEYKSEFAFKDIAEGLAEYEEQIQAFENKLSFAII